MPVAGKQRVHGEPASSAGGRRKVLVLGEDARSFLTTIRSLGRAGIEVHVAWCDRHSLAARSRYIHQLHALPPYPEERAAWLAAFVELLKRERFDLVFPTHDPSVVALHEHRAVLEHLVPLALPPPAAYEIVYDKRATAELARSLDIPMPRERCVGDPADLEGLGTELGWPLVLKPRRSFAFGRKKWEHHVRKARDVRELDAYARALLVQGEVLVQEHVPGRGAGIEVLCAEGEVLLAFQHDRIHEPPAGGGSSYRVSRALDPRLHHATIALMRALDYTGVAMVEFKVDSQARTWSLIEINGRLWGSLPLAVACGADFPLALVESCLDQRQTFEPDYATGRYGRNLSMDVAWFLQNRKADRSDPTLATVPLSQVLRELVHPCLGRERWDSLTLDDPRPFLGEVVGLMRTYGGHAWTKLRALPWQAAALRRWRARRLGALLERSRSVLFVCKGNICRSPLAAQLTARRYPDKTLTSAGDFQEAGRTCPSEGITAARALGIDLSRHRSRVVDSAQIEAADLVLVFDQGNYDVVRTRFPGVRGKLHRVGFLTADGPVNLRDPYGGGLASFEQSYAAIAHALYPAHEVALQVAEP